MRLSLPLRCRSTKYYLSVLGTTEEIPLFCRTALLFVLKNEKLQIRMNRVLAKKMMAARSFCLGGLSTPDCSIIKHKQIQRKTHIACTRSTILQRNSSPLI
ncbi:hypothetical protein XENORESO_016375 [Xenotaenia resolanae]|uniref:Uncharacterized protein n=1 Tax=Xenotaenia resolanae TaxID=208358 RepID=A0ABV0WR23_9TELE